MTEKRKVHEPAKAPDSFTKKSLQWVIKYEDVLEDEEDLAEYVISVEEDEHQPLDFNDDE